MSESIISSPWFHNEESAYEFIEKKLWPHGPVCPHCGEMKRVSKMRGKSTRMGTYKCYACRKPFTVKIGTVFEDSHIPLRHWLQAIHLMASSKKGISANQLHRTLGVTLKSAWFMAHRIRYAMDQEPDSPFTGIVEVDETYVGGKEKGRRGRGGNKTPVVALVQRNGSVVSKPVDHVTAYNLRKMIVKNVDKSAKIMTDDYTGYVGKLGDFAAHHVVNHSAKEYARGEVHTNTVEGYFSILKRGIIGVYHHCEKQHLHRYCSEFDFRYNTRTAKGFNDTDRAEELLYGIVGKRLTYAELTAKEDKKPEAVF